MVTYRLTLCIFVYFDNDCWTATFKVKIMRNFEGKNYLVYEK